MAKIPLRTYSRDIENLVDRGELDEAIAHCRHILNAYPKHLESYRLLGKAYLEARRYNEATNIFERVLMAVPDDFVAQVGMSIIQDEQKNMDAAIWHMERAFEVQPSNAAIQGELQRLYGRRDGIEPPKIRLTRGALAHMYVQGELYPQAISEIKNVLEEDPERQDMQTLLARAYFRAGQKSEAAEICSQLLRRYPYCLDANRVLVELLPKTEQGESVQVYRQRVNELDPYAAFVTGSIFHTEEVSDTAVGIERLEWDGQPVDVPSDWGESQGIGRNEGGARDETPDWLRAGLMDETPAASASTEEPAPVMDDSDIPDFLREAGWGESTGSFQEGPGVFDESDESAGEPAIEQGDLPDWVKAMAPTGMDLENAASQPEPNDDLTSDDVPDWLQGLESAQETSSAEQPLAEDGMPDWLESMRPTEEASPQSEELAAPISESDEGLPDWLASMQAEEATATTDASQERVAEEQATPIPESDEGLPDWLASMPSEDATVSTDAPQESAEGEAAPLPEWQFDEEPPSGQVETTATESDSLGTSAAEQDDAIAWLESLATKHGAKPEELVTSPEDRKEAEPEWVRQARETGEAEPPVAQEKPEEPVEEAIAPVDLPDFLAKKEAEPAAGTVPPFEAAEMGEIENTAEETGEPSSEPGATFEAAEMGDVEPLAEEVEPVGESAAAFDAIDTGGLGTSAAEQDDAIAWLEGLAAKHGAKPEELVTNPEDRKESEPEWVQQAREAGAAEPVVEGQPQEPVAEEPVSPAVMDETGIFLQSLEESESIQEQEITEGVEPLITEEAVPDWLQEMEADVPKAEAAQTSEDEADIPEWLRGMEASPSQAESTSGSMPEEEGVPEPAQQFVGKVDINSASIEELAILPGIGDLLAQDIVAHRETFGAFLSVEDLGKIGGIGPATIDDLRDLVEVGEIEMESQIEDANLSDWLQSLDAESVETAPEQAPPEKSAEEDLPFWLADLAEETDQTPAPAAPGDDLPDWLRAEAEGEAVPPEPTRAADWRPLEPPEPPEPPRAEQPFVPEVEEEPAAEPEAQVPSPETFESGPEAETLPPTAIEPKPEPAAETPELAAFEPEPEAEPELEPQPTAPLEREPVTRSRTGMTGMLSPVQQPVLTQAQNELTRGNILGALENYGKLIKKGKMLDEVIFDLREALYSYPVDVTILQTLGDAYMRANRLQDALDSYTKAEELLR